MAFAPGTCFAAISRGSDMLITFKSGVCADVMMFGDVARQMMELMGKAPDSRGVITVEQMPAAIARLRQAVAEDRRLHAAPPAGGDEEEEEERRNRVSVTQRALPLIDLLECSLREESAVTWGV
jgi:hypothetical protein